jgi:hypothetical protein
LATGFLGGIYPDYFIRLYVAVKRVGCMANIAAEKTKAYSSVGLLFQNNTEGNWLLVLDFWYNAYWPMGNFFMVAYLGTNLGSYRCAETTWLSMMFLGIGGLSGGFFLVGSVKL